MDGVNVAFEDFNQAKKALEEVNNKLRKVGLPDAKISKIRPDMEDTQNFKKLAFGIDIPQIGFKKLYRQGGNIPVSSQGVYEYPKQEGKVVKDDNGYWNPDNWGKAVEIDSNNITMKGVYEPLYAVPDVGSPILMFPNQDYIFKNATKVTEYPIRNKRFK
jgi:hypothetical protein